MAHPLLNKSSLVSTSVQQPVIPPPPKLMEFIRQWGVTPRAFEAYDNANAQHNELANQSIGRVFDSLKQTP